MPAYLVLVAAGSATTQSVSTRHSVVSSDTSMRTGRLGSIYRAWNCSTVSVRQLSRGTGEARLLLPRSAIGPSTGRSRQRDGSSGRAAERPDRRQLSALTTQVGRLMQ